MEDSLSLAYLIQFGLSGLVLCVCAFQLSVVSKDRREISRNFVFQLSDVLVMSIVHCAGWSF